WIINTALPVVLLILLIRERRRPCAFSMGLYVSSRIVTSLVDWFLKGTQGWAYPIAFWTGQSVLIIVLAAFVYDIWRQGLADYPGFHRLCAILLMGTLLFSLVV